MPTLPIVISGSIAIDRIMGFDGQYGDHILPEKLDSLSISIFLNALRDTPGGVGANIAYSLAMLGATPVLLGSVGPDARHYVDSLSARGVDTSGVHFSELPTASFNVITDAAQNQIGGFYPGAMFDSAGLSLEPWRHDQPLVVVSPHDPAAMRRQVAQAKEWGLKLCYDIGQQVSNTAGDALREGLDAAHILILNDYELSALSAKTGRSIDSIKAAVPIVVTTLGGEGSVIEGKAVPKPIRVGIAKPGAEVDPTGAGDAYRAGFLYGFASGWDLETAAQLGATVAAYALEHQGTQGHEFTLEDVTNRYKQNFGSGLPAHKETI